LWGMDNAFHFDGFLLTLPTATAYSLKFVL
jgi:hypothetical protein